LAANQRWPAIQAASESDGRLFDAIANRARDQALQPEPVEVVRAEREDVRRAADRGKARVAQHLDGRHALQRREIQLDRLRPGGEVRDHQHRVVLPAPEIGQHRLVARAQELDAAAAEHRRALAGGDERARGVEQGGGQLVLRGHVDRLVVVDRVGDDGQVELGGLRGGEAGVAVGRPLHRRAHAVAIAQVDVVAHAELVAVVDDRAARQREQQAGEQLDAPPVVVEQRGQPPADPEVQLHVGIGGVGEVHVVALLVRHHLERQLVVVAQEEAPLAGRRDRRRVGEDVGDGQPVLAPHAHVQARHQREVEGHVELVAVAEVGPHVLRPLVGLGQEHAAAAVLAIDDGAFVSMLDPAGDAEVAAASCVSDGTFPVLVGEQDAHDVVLSSPIILYDHPQIAPESPGDLFDATEIDEILTLRTMALTDDEKREARATDPRAAAIIDRVDAMPPEILERLHGAIRSLRPVASPAAEPPTTSTLPFFSFLSAFCWSSRTRSALPILPSRLACLFGRSHKKSCIVRLHLGGRLNSRLKTYLLVLKYSESLLSGKCLAGINGHSRSVRSRSSLAGLSLKRCSL